MERAKYKYTSLASKQELLRPKREFYHVQKGLKSKATAELYTWHFNAFLKYVNWSEEDILRLGNNSKDPRATKLQRKIIEYLSEHLDKERHLKPDTIATAMAAILYFCDINDILLNRKKIRKLSIPADEDHEIDRAYTHKEIQDSLDISDERLRVVFLLMANGMRVGAIPDLRIGHLEEIPLGDEDDKEAQRVYKISVYHRSKRGRYYTFCTPECFDAIQKYLKFRKDHGDDITNKNNPLIKERFNQRSRTAAAIAKALPLDALNKTIERQITRSGIDTKSQRVMRANGFRKFAITQMKQAGVDFSDREYLVGHRISRGLDVSYDRTTEEERRFSWQKAIDLLTINPEFRLKKKLQKIEGEHSKKLVEQYLFTFSVRI
jgi:hypothetical protein